MMMPHHSVRSVTHCLTLVALLGLAACNGANQNTELDASSSVAQSSSAETSSNDRIQSSAQSSSSTVPSSLSSLSSAESSSNSSHSVSISRSSTVSSSLSSVSSQVSQMSRTACPSAPPELQTYTFNPFNLEVSKQEYSALLGSKKTYQGSRTELPYHLYEPEQAEQNAGSLYPLVVSLHGGFGSEETDGNILVDGAPSLLGSSNGLLTTTNRERYPAYILLPHCSRDLGCHWSVGHEWASNGGARYPVADQASKITSALLEFIEELIRTKQVDPSRIYFTGISMGGGGSWEIALRRPDLASAVVTVAGHTPADRFLSNIADHKVPFWALTAENDNNNPEEDTQHAVQQIANADGCAWMTKLPINEHNHNLWAKAYQNPDLWPWVFAQTNPEYNQSSSTAQNNITSSFSAQESSSSESSSTASSAPTSLSSISCEGLPSGTDNSYSAPFTSQAPTIDGGVESLWDNAPVDAINIAWRVGHENLSAPSGPNDFTGCYKALWDENKLYVLVKIKDDIIKDWKQDPLREYWLDDTIEIFIDEDKSGGDHQGGNPANAFAYHVSTLGDVVDIFPYNAAVLSNHIEVKRIATSANDSIWEMAITIWGADYRGEANHSPLTLFEGKTMGFTMSYIDQDGANDYTRESFIGSVDSNGHQNNEGFQRSDGFGTLRLVE